MFLGLWYHVDADPRVSRRVKDGLLCGGALTLWWEEYGGSSYLVEGEALKVNILMRRKRSRLMRVWAEMNLVWWMACVECDRRYNTAEIWEDAEEKFMEDDVAEVKRITWKNMWEKKACSIYKRLFDFVRLFSG